MTAQRTWRGQALYFDTATSQTLNVEAAISSSGITIIHEGSEKPVPWDQMKIIPAGRSFVRIELSMPAGSVLTIHSPDATAALSANKKLRYGVRGELTRNRRLTGIIIGGIAGVLLFLYAGVPLLVDACVGFVPHTVDAKLGKSVLSSFETPLGSGDSLRLVLDKCARILGEFRTAALPDSFVIHVAEDTSIVNAVAFPGGVIVIYRGLLFKLEHESELFALLGHEAGHIVERHGMKNLTRQVLFSVALSLFLRQTSGLADFYISNSSALLNLSYDRSQEREADEFGLQMMHAASFDPDGMVRLFEKLKAATKDETRIPLFLSTHPDIDDRISALRNRIAKLAPVSREQRLTADEWRILTLPVTSSQ